VQLCIKHFKDEFQKSGKEIKSKWEVRPDQKFHTEKALKQPSTLLTATLT